MVNMLRSYKFHGTVSSNLKDLRQFTDNLLKTIKPVIVDENVIFDLKLIINELMINGAVHGNCSDDFKQVFLGLSIDDRNVKIVVQDEGIGIAGKKTSINRCDYDPHGRGLMIVKALSDEMKMDKNIVTVIKRYR